MDFKDAIKVVKETLKSDELLWDGYKSNIAVSFQDAYENRQCSPPDAAEIHRVSNIAAENFLNRLCE